MVFPVQTFGEMGIDVNFLYIKQDLNFYLNKVTVNFEMGYKGTLTKRNLDPVAEWSPSLIPTLL